MKKKLLLIGLITVCCVYAGTSIFPGSGTAITLKGLEYFSGSDSYQVKVNARGELATTSIERENNVYAALSDAAVVTTTYYCLVDLSDTTNYPHDSTGRIDVSVISLTIDRDSTATGNVKLGIITRIDGTDADISYLASEVFEKSDLRHLDHDINLSPTQLRFAANGGGILYGITANSESNVVAVNTGVSLDSPRGATSCTPAVGDLIVKASRIAGEYQFALSILYHSEPTP